MINFYFFLILNVFIYRFYFSFQVNQNEENCLIFVYKTRKNPAHNNINNQNQTNRLHKHHSQYKLVHDSQQLIGFTYITYYKDNYFNLCEYLFHSVYDSKSLENFDIQQYLQTFIKLERDREEQELRFQSESQTSLEENYENYKKQQYPHQTENDNHIYANLNSIDKFKLKSFKSSAFLHHYLFYLDKINKNRLKYNFLDEKLSKASKLIQLPPDWTVLGQLCYLDKGIFSLFFRLHFKFIKSTNVRLS